MRRVDLGVVGATDVLLGSAPAIGRPALLGRVTGDDLRPAPVEICTLLVGEEFPVGETRGTLQGLFRVSRPDALQIRIAEPQAVVGASSGAASWPWATTDSTALGSCVSPMSPAITTIPARYFLNIVDLLRHVLGRAWIPNRHEQRSPRHLSFEWTHTEHPPPTRRKARWCHTPDQHASNLPLPPLGDVSWDPPVGGMKLVRRPVTFPTVSV